MKKITSKSIEATVFSAIDRLKEVLPPNARLDRSRSGMLLGDGASLDSMAVVNLLVLIEEQMLDGLGVEILLAGEDGESDGIDPAALSTVGSLIDAICARVGATD